MLLVTVYRPLKYTVQPYDNFTKFLLAACIDFDRAVITGDPNIHLDHPENGSAKDFLCILDNFKLLQHAKDSTHNIGHTLNVVISKGLHVSEVVVADVSLSDHYCVLFDITIF